MAKQLKIRKLNKYGWLGSSMMDEGMGKARIPEKIVDIIEDCPNANGPEKCLLVFSRNSRDGSDRAVEVSRPTRSRPKKNFKNGWYVVFRLTKLGKVSFKNRRYDRETFLMSASDLGLSEKQLRFLVEKHAPPKKERVHLK